MPDAERQSAKRRLQMEEVYVEEEPVAGPSWSTFQTPRKIKLSQMTPNQRQGNK